MYLYFTFFNEDILKKGKFFASGKYLEQIKNNFSDYIILSEYNIKGAIAVLNDRSFSDKNPYLVKIDRIDSNDQKIEIYFEIEKKMTITNDYLQKQLYRYSKNHDFIDTENKYPPTLFMLNKKDFDSIRKGTVNARKITNKTEKINQYKINNNWKAIVDLFNPIEDLNKSDSWNNASELSDIAFACSKLAELDAGKEGDKVHLSEIKKYRELCYFINNRCMELETKNFLYPYGIAYRHYSNVMEISKHKGRKDGNLNEEIENAITWFDKALKLFPDNIKILNKKAYLLLDKKADILRFATNDKSRMFFIELGKIEKEGFKCLEKVIEIYENIDDVLKQKRYRKEYIKALYRLSKFKFKGIQDYWNEYACNKIMGTPLKMEYMQQNYIDILFALDRIEKCIYTITNHKINKIDEVSKNIKNEQFWNGSPSDMLYLVGNIYLLMFFIKVGANENSKKTEEYRDLAESYLIESVNVGTLMKREGKTNRNTWFVSEKLARLYIIKDNFKEAVRLLERSKDSYIRNTYAIALILENSEQSRKSAKEVLTKIINDRYNMADALTLSLLLYLYQTNGEYREIEKLKKIKKNTVVKSEKLLTIFNLNESEAKV